MQFKTLKVGEAKDYIITAILILLSVTIAVSRNQGGIHSLRQFSAITVSVLQSPLANIRVYRQALTTNTYLQRQNILLQDELSKLRAIEQENIELRKLLSFQDSTEFNLTPTLIIGKELNGINKSLTINSGSSKNVKVGMPLVTSDGLLGKVILTTADYAQVLPYNNSLFRVSGLIQENNAPGIVSWNGESLTEMVIDFIPQTIPVEAGYTVVTSGFSNELPAGIPIGSVIRTEIEEGKETQRIFLKPFASLAQASQGFIINFTPDSSLTNLNDQYEDIFE
ncbi:MAG: rod shape-determining protein MreC [Balneola sp.]|nr:rod shape-determining protein MreC [Balneola sp.]MBO6651393.1 rod shape-determining protein MreC [Balneola sp.]MBO6710980.1 rod shape-determining protein MreC [Balneola sp.]MBO6801496.1 rod shape-determining protein MreC [Balneola sp.]MBO6870400.1 rod shape-determining protein MreC [Balneola sp.]